jgi:hypothetical protein
MKTVGPAMNLRTSCWLLPQNERLRATKSPCVNAKRFQKGIPIKTRLVEARKGMLHHRKLIGQISARNSRYTVGVILGRIPDVTESFYAIVQRRRFPNPLLRNSSNQFSPAQEQIGDWMNAALKAGGSYLRVLFEPDSFRAPSASWYWSHGLVMSFR